MKEKIAKMLGYEENEIEVFDEEGIKEYYEETLEEMLGKELFDKLISYIDVWAMINDDILSGFLMEVEVNGKKYYVMEV